jgi:hypothetical protein
MSNAAFKIAIMEHFYNYNANPHGNAVNCWLADYDTSWIKTLEKDD